MKGDYIMANTFDIFSYTKINLNTFTLHNSEQNVLEIPKITSIVDTVTINAVDKDSKVCKVCGRKLKDVDSCHIGMGPICYYKYRQALNKCKPLF